MPDRNAPGKLPPKARRSDYDEKDIDRLKSFLTRTVKVPIPPGTKFKNTDTRRALNYSKVYECIGEFMKMSDKSIDALKVPALWTQDPTTGAWSLVHDERDLSIADKSRLKIALAYLHFKFRQHGGPIPFKLMTPEDFQVFRMTCDPSERVIFWNKPTQQETEENLIWAKNLKLDYSNYKPLKDDAAWTTWREETELQLKNDSLYEVVDKSLRTKIEIENPIRAYRKRIWVYRMFQQKFKTPKTKSIVQKYTKTQDTWNCWDDIALAQDESTTTQNRISEYSSFLTTTKINNWKGAKTAFFYKFLETARLYNEISPHPYVPAQLAIFLSNAVQDHKDYNHLYGNALEAKRSTGARGANLFVDFETYFSSCRNVAENKDTASGANHTTESALVKIHEFDEVDDDDERSEEEDEDVEYDINVTDSSKRRVYLSKDVWKDLSNEERTAWDLLNEKSKEKILEYGRKRSIAKENFNKKSNLKPKPRFTKVNKHESDVTRNLLFLAGKFRTLASGLG